MKCDICILGTGAAGLFLADRLARNPALRIVLVEAGPREYAARREPFVVSSFPRQHEGVNAARVTAFGGATNTWGGGLLRLTARDMEPLAADSGTGWSLSYAELEAGYADAEQALGIAASKEGTEGEVYACGDLGFRRRLITVLPFKRKNFAHTLGRKLLASPNVTALFDASRLTEILTSNGQIDSLEVLTREHVRTRIQADRYVIAAGIVNSNLLVRHILAAIDPSAISLALGRYFHDHISLPLFSITPRSSSAFSQRFSYRFSRSLMFGEHYEIEFPVAQGQTGGFFHFTFDFANSTLLQGLKQGLEGVQQHGLRGLLRWPLRALFRSAGTATRLAAMRALHHRLLIPGEVKIQGVLDLEQLPKADWRLDLIGDGDAAGCRLTWDIDAGDVQNAGRYALATRALVRELSQESEFEARSLFPDPGRSPTEFEAYVRSTATDTYHAAGGLRMGTDPARSVVSPNLDLHGVTNVSVVSTAVFPRSGAANPTLTLLALASRLARRSHGSLTGSDIIAQAAESQ